MEQSKKEKTRHLTIYQFFEILQIEWLVADLRFRIAVKAKDKEYWKKVKEGKKQTIEMLADRNSLPTIFTDSDLKADFEKRIYGCGNYPNFHYKDEVAKQMQGYWDMVHYYKVGVEVRFEQFSEVRVGKIKEYRPNADLIKIEYEQEVYDLCIKEISRIL